MSYTIRKATESIKVFGKFFELGVELRNNLKYGLVHLSLNKNGEMFKYNKQTIYFRTSEIDSLINDLKRFKKEINI